MADSFRRERDYLGEVEVPSEAYYGAHTARAIQNFKISGVRAHPLFIRFSGLVKWAAAVGNMKAGTLDRKIGEAICRAAEEVYDGSLMDQFVVDVFQAGAGTSHNMNTNEVIANRAIELLGGRKGDYSLVHPNDHVNMGQSTNDFFPTVIRVTALHLLTALQDELARTISSLKALADRYDRVVKSGRTHLMDAAPIRYGQVFGGWARTLSKDGKRLDEASKGLLELNLGGSAVGTGVNAEPAYVDEAIRFLSEKTGFKFTTPESFVDVTHSMADMLWVASALKALAVDISKISSDLRLMNSGPATALGEVTLPAVQPGSSIMPGKVNPVIAECMNMICFHVMGCERAIEEAAHAGQLELNVMMPLIAYDLNFSFEIMTNGLKMLREKLLDGLTVNAERSKKLLEASSGIALALNPYLGFDRTAELVREAMKRGVSVRELVKEERLMSEEELDRVLDPYRITKRGVVKA
jgi:aspartate ammonia-lyase